MRMGAGNVMQISLEAALLDLLASVLLGAGVLGLASPLVIFWWIQGDSERYFWIVHGPHPYSHFGSGPVQMAMGVGLLLLAGLLLTAGIGLKWWMWRRLDAEVVL